MRRHYALSGLVIATAIVAGTAVLRSDAIVVTRAMLASTVSEVFIERDSIVVELEIGAADLPSFRNLLPDGAYEAMGYEPTPWAERLDRFFTEDFVISEDGRHPLPGRLLDLTTRERIKRDEVTGEPIPLAEDEEPEPVVFARLWYDLPPTPPALEPATVIRLALGNVAFATSMPAVWLRRPRWKRTTAAGTPIAAPKAGSNTALSPEKTDPSQSGM